MKTNASCSSIESLESRIAPAAVTINAALKSATWTDFDGDLVTLKYSTAAPEFGTTDQGAGLRVDYISLTAAANSMESFVLTVKAGPTGDGHVDLGRIAAMGVPLKSWSSPTASIAEFDCGNGTIGIGTLTTGTLGSSLVSQFSNTGGEGVSAISGTVSTVDIRGDVAGTTLFLPAAGKMKSLKISGSLRGTDVSVSGQSSGHVAIVASEVKAISIGGSIIGGDSQNDGHLVVVGAVGTLTIKGGIRGGSGLDTGTVVANAKAVSIGGDIVGGSEIGTGTLSLADVKTLTIGGSIEGGTEAQAGNVLLGSAGTVKIKGNIEGRLQTSATQAGQVGTFSASGDVGSLSVDGGLIAGTFGSGVAQPYNGAILVGGNLGSLTIGGEISGNNNTKAFILAKGSAPATAGNYQAIGKLAVGGSVSYAYIASGHAKDLTAGNSVGAAENPDAGIGRVTVGGNWFHSNLTAGVNDANSTGFSSGDTHSLGDVSRQAVLGPIVIKGQALDSAAAPGFSGFGAERIASIIAGGVKLFKTGDANRSLDAAGFVDIVEFA